MPIQLYKDKVKHQGHLHWTKPSIRCKIIATVVSRILRVRFPTLYVERKVAYSIHFLISPSISSISGMLKRLGFSHGYVPLHVSDGVLRYQRRGKCDKSFAVGYSWTVCCFTPFLRFQNERDWWDVQSNLFTRRIRANELDGPYQPTSLSGRPLIEGTQLYMEPITWKEGSFHRNCTEPYGQYGKTKKVSLIKEQ